MPRRIYGATLVRVQGNYDQVNRLCSEVAQKHSWGIVNVNLRSYYSEGSKTVGYEIAEQLGWRLPQNIVVPMAGGSLITKIHKAFEELKKLGWVEPAATKLLRRPGDGLLAHHHGGQARNPGNRSAETAHHRQIARHRQPGRRHLCGQDDP